MSLTPDTASVGWGDAASDPVDAGAPSVPMRAPYFHDGSAATLEAVVEFYVRRFNINFTAQEKKDLVNFMKTL